MPRNQTRTDMQNSRAASSRLGVSLDYYLAQRDLGLRWCSRRKHWCPRDLMCRRPNLRDGVGTECKQCTSDRANAHHKEVRRKAKEAAALAALALADLAAERDGDWPPAVLANMEGRMKLELVKQILEQGGPDVVNSRNVKFADMHKTVYIGRGSLWGNPHKLAGIKKYDPSAREIVVKAFLKDMLNMEPAERINWLWPLFEALRQGKTLRCFCAPKLCHGHALAAWIRNHPEFALYWEEEAHKKQGAPLA